MARELAPWFGVAKVGLELFSAAGPDAIARLRELDLAVFADMKLHDIPTTVERAARVLGRYGASYVNFHAAGGVDMMRGALAGLADGARDAGRPAPVGLAVTVLTSEEDASAFARATARGRRCGLRWCRLLDARGRGGQARAARISSRSCRVCGSRATTETINGGSGHRRPSPRPAPTSWWSDARSRRPTIRRAPRGDARGRGRRRGGLARLVGARKPSPSCGAGEGRYAGPPSRRACTNTQRRAGGNRPEQ